MNEKLTENQKAIAKIKEITGKQKPVEQAEVIESLAKYAIMPKIVLTIFYDTGNEQVSMNTMGAETEDRIGLTRAILTAAENALRQLEIEAVKKQTIEEISKEKVGE